MVQIEWRGVKKNCWLRSVRQRTDKETYFQTKRSCKRGVTSVYMTSLDLIYTKQCHRLSFCPLNNQPEPKCKWLIFILKATAGCRRELEKQSLYSDLSDKYVIYFNYLWAECVWYIYFTLQNEERINCVDSTIIIYIRYRCIEHCV